MSVKLETERKTYKSIVTTYYELKDLL